MRISFIHYLFLLCIGFCWLSCANIAAPTGGPRDDAPPSIRKRSLIDSAVNFKGGIISFEFDENVQVKDIQNQLIITPLLKTNPNITAHKRTVKINLHDSLLQPNTTYSISMGNAVQDLREGNPYSNLSFIFSTGPFFDSLTLRGSVNQANTGKPDTSSLILLYPAGLPDSVLFREKPLYVQKTLGGTFLFRNLPAREFSIFALTDVNKNLRYDLNSERMAFYNSTVNPKDTTVIKLFSFVSGEITDTSKRKKVMQRAATNVAKSELKKISFSLNADTVNKTKRTFGLKDTLKFQFNAPVKSFDETRIRVFQDSILDASVGISLDSTGQVLNIVAHWAEDALYRVNVLKGFVSDSSGLQALASGFSFRTKRRSDYGFITARCDQNKNDVLELMLNDQVLARQACVDTTVQFHLLGPESYQLRILHDLNGNGVWDSGSFFVEKKQPELVEWLPNLITIKANWENKIDIRESLREKNKSRR